MAQITEFGKKIKIALIGIEKPQTWLIDRVREETGLYFDDSYLSKIINGTLRTPKITAAICDILGITNDTP